MAALKASDSRITGSEARYRLMPHAFITVSSLLRDSSPNVTSTLSSAAIGITKIHELRRHVDQQPADIRHGRLPLENLVGPVEERRDVEQPQQRQEREPDDPDVDAADIAVQEAGTRQPQVRAAGSPGPAPGQRRPARGAALLASERRGGLRLLPVLNGRPVPGACRHPPEP